MDATDFIELDGGPYGKRWSYPYDPELQTPPTVEEAEKVLGVKLTATITDGEGLDRDGEFLAEAVYFLAEDFSGNTLATYQAQ